MSQLHSYCIFLLPTATCICSLPPPSFSRLVVSAYDVSSFVTVLSSASQQNRTRLVIFWLFFRPVLGYQCSKELLLSSVCDSFSWTVLQLSIRETKRGATKRHPALNWTLFKPDVDDPRTWFELWDCQRRVKASCSMKMISGHGPCLLGLEQCSDPSSHQFLAILRSNNDLREYW